MASGPSQIQAPRASDAPHHSFPPSMNRGPPGWCQHACCGRQVGDRERTERGLRSGSIAGADSCVAPRVGSLTRLQVNAKEACSVRGMEPQRAGPRRTVGPGAHRRVLVLSVPIDCSAPSALADERPYKHGCAELDCRIRGGISRRGNVRASSPYCTHRRASPRCPGCP